MVVTEQTGGTSGQESGGSDGEEDSGEQQAAADVVGDRGEGGGDGAREGEAGARGEQEAGARAAGTVPEKRERGGGVQEDIGLVEDLVLERRLAVQPLLKFYEGTVAFPLSRPQISGT